MKVSRGNERKRNTIIDTPNLAMPKLSVVAVRLAFVYLAGGSTIGAVLMSRQALSLPPAVQMFRPLHIELLLIGWLVQLAVGVGFWILPRFGRQRGNTSLAVSAIVLLNLGLWIVAGGQLYWSAGSILPAVGRTFEAAGALLFGLHVWQRIKPARSRRS